METLVSLAKQIFTNEVFCSDFIPAYRRQELIPIVFLDQVVPWQDDLGMLVQYRAQASLFCYEGYPVFAIGTLIPPDDAAIIRIQLHRLRAERAAARLPPVKTRLWLNGRSVSRLPPSQVS